MCIACEMSFWHMLDALPPETRERILREQADAARFACETPPAPDVQPAEDERKP